MKQGNPIGMIVVIVLIMVAIGAIAYFALRPSSDSGTVNPEVRQMKAGARGRK